MSDIYRKVLCNFKTPANQNSVDYQMAVLHSLARKEQSEAAAQIFPLIAAFITGAVGVAQTSLVNAKSNSTRDYTLSIFQIGIPVMLIFIVGICKWVENNAKSELSNLLTAEHLNEFAGSPTLENLRVRLIGPSEANNMQNPPPAPAIAALTTQPA